MSVPAPEDPGFRYPQFVGEQTEHEAVAPSALKETCERSNLRGRTRCARRL